MDQIMLFIEHLMGYQALTVQPSSHLYELTLIFIFMIKSLLSETENFTN